MAVAFLLFSVFVSSVGLARLDGLALGRSYACCLFLFVKSDE